MESRGKMKEINFKKKDVENLTVYDTGGYEGRIYIYSQDLLLKIFEDYLRKITDLNIKKYKLIRLKEKGIPDNIIIKPERLVSVENVFSGYLMPKIEDSILVDSLSDLKKIIKVFRILFENLEILHKNNIIINDIKPENILIDKNKTPIFIDSDSMGVDEYLPDSPNLKTTISKKVHNIDHKINRYDPEDLDKLKLLACFVHCLEKKTKKTERGSHHQENKPLVNILFESDLSLDFKKYVSNALYTDDNLKKALTDVNHMFLREEMTEYYRRRK